MEVIISKHVLLGIEKYADALAYYPISNDRACAKVHKMIDALQSIGANPLANPVCKYVNLGQSLDAAGNPKNPYLRQFVYKDESNRPGSFAYLIAQHQQRIYITSMMYSAFIVNESPEIRKILSLMERMDDLN